MPLPDPEDLFFMILWLILAFMVCVFLALYIRELV